MARLNEDERKAIIAAAARPWVQNEAIAKLDVVQPTMEARQRYCLWATEAAVFFKGRKPVHFSGEQWKL